MDAMCAGCGRTIPDFSRTCEHCGHGHAEQLTLPTVELSPRENPQLTTASEDFDFAPDASSLPSDGFDFPAEVSPDPGPQEAAQFEPPHESMFEPQPETRVPEISETASAGVPSGQSALDEQVGVSTNGLLFGTSPAASSTPAEPPVRSNRREIVFVTLAAAVGGVVTLGWLLARTAPGPEVAVAASSAGAPSAAARTAASADPISAPRNQWTSANSAVWVGDARNAIALELEAENSVGVWMRTVRPALIIRCSAGNVEAFVFTSSAARIEPKTEDHTVQVSFDGATEATEHWPDSEEHDALFAPDGAALVRRLAAARVMRFGFSPHNAAPVTVEFNVAGLSTILAPLSRQCGSTF